MHGSAFKTFVKPRKDRSSNQSDEDIHLKASRCKQHKGKSSPVAKRFEKIASRINTARVEFTEPELEYSEKFNLVSPLHFTKSLDKN